MNFKKWGLKVSNVVIALVPKFPVKYIEKLRKILVFCKISIFFVTSRKFVSTLNITPFFYELVSNLIKYNNKKKKTEQIL